MDRRSGTRNWSFGPAHVGAVFSQQHPDSIVQGLREALYSAITQIKSLEVENKALKEQAGLMENRQMEVSQLQEELKQKDDLLKRAIKKRRARTRAHVDTLVLLTQKEKELKRSEEQWRRTCDVLEVSLISKTNQLQKLTLKNTKKQKQLVIQVKEEQEEDKTKEEEEDENERKSKKEKEKMEKEQKEKAKEDGKENMEKEQIEKVKKERKGKMENKLNEKEMKRSEEKEINDKKSERRRGVTSRRWVQTDRHQYRGRNCWFNSSQTSAGDPSY